MLKLELWVGQMVGANMCRLNNGKDGSCFCWGATGRNMGEADGANW